MGEKRDTRISQTPGPGDYELKSEKKDGFTMGQRIHSKPQEELPGPGQYANDAPKTGPQFSIGEK